MPAVLSSYSCSYAMECIGDCMGTGSSEGDSGRAVSTSAKGWLFSVAV